ncbi:MAG: hypothetical protein KC910_17920, partial [Candidatus Eremiobacteraeota bacterium]|nr:hypothetical protein [Candidatus Eremiobacteraeota bacterium]
MRLDDYLQQQLQGGQFNSSGNFTLDLIDARDKLQRYRLPAPEYYLLKLVQCADRLGTGSVRVRLAPFETLVTFVVSEKHDITDFEPLLNALTDPYKLEDGALRHLVVAISAALTVDPKEICWLVRHGSQGLRLRITEENIESDSLAFENPFVDGKIRCTFYLRHRKSWKFWENAKRNAECLQLLSSRCLFSRIPVVVDGRNLQATWDYERFAFKAAWFAHHSQAYHLAERFLLCDGPGAITFRRPYPHAYEVSENGLNIWKPALWFDNQTFLESSDTRCYLCEVLSARRRRPTPLAKLPDRIQVKAAFALPLNLEGPSFLGFVKDSVLLNFNEQELDLPGLVGIFSADGQTLDLTDFQVVQTDQYEERVAEFRQEGESMFALARNQANLFRPIGVAGVFGAQD